MIGLDSNVLLRFVLADHPTQSPAAKRFVDQCTRRGDFLFVSNIVLAETVWVLRRGYKYARHDVAALLESLLDSTGLVFEQPSSIIEALDDYRQGKAGFVDYLVGAVARAAGCRQVVTFDRKLQGSGVFHGPDGN